MAFFKKKTADLIPAAPVFGPMEYIICGLGNPGEQYGNTRHNTGFCALDVLASQAGARVDRVRFHALCGDAMVGGHHVLLMKPTTFMNLSGQAVQEALAFYKLSPDRLIVLSDDISLAVGKMRIRAGGSAGGHNGLKNIILQTGSDRFPRIRFGVGEKPCPEYDLADWVLGKFTPEEGKLLYSLFLHTPEACALIMEGKTTEAMSKFNGTGTV